MQTLIWEQLDTEARRAALARPVAERSDSVRAQAQSIIDAVRTGGDAALRELALRFDGAAPEALQVTAAEFAAARAELDAAQIQAIQIAIDNVRRFHAPQLPQEYALETQEGVRCERLNRPLAAVGLYVPAGSAPLPSTVIMLAVPAGIARCPQRVLCTPPRRDGRANPAVLVAAELCGIDTVFKVGGAQAIAALAYGTESIPKVAKIFGPGNAWVTAAKQLVAADPDGAALDMPAGPSEVMVVADDSADAGFVAADLLAQAEHDPSAQAILVTTSATLAAQVDTAVRTQMQTLSRNAILQQSVQSVRLLVVNELNTALDIVNDYAPEHLLIQTREPRALLPHVDSAGSVFLGRWTPESMGDYCSGTNHVLPTYGYARAYSGLSVLDFVRRMTVQELSRSGLKGLGPTAATLAHLEGLDAHARAVELRLESAAAQGTLSGGHA
ncbi:MAG: histidinol dehydrogenase [Steroidobacteraceae bacterium]